MKVLSTYTGIKFQGVCGARRNHRKARSASGHNLLIPLRSQVDSQELPPEGSGSIVRICANT